MVCHPFAQKPALLKTHVANAQRPTDAEIALALVATVVLRITSIGTPATGTSRSSERDA